VTVLLAGVTVPDELTRFAELVGQTPELASGGVLQNAAAVYDVQRFTRPGHAVWVDFASLVRSVEGRTDDLLPTAPRQDRRAEPILADSPLVAWLLGRMSRDEASLVGLELPDASRVLATELHDLGVRRFAGSPVHAEQIRLVLGQHAQLKKKEKHHG
jgi:hypothetical protein